MRRLAVEQTEHDELVRMMANYFKSLGYTEIRADIPEYETPAEIHWTNQPQQRYRPDLTCRMNDTARTLIILEAEICNSLTGEHTTQQFRIFRANATQNRGQFHVVVPRVCGTESGNDRATRFCNRIEIRVDHIWWPSQ